MKPGDGLEAEANGIINLDSTVVRTSGSQSISGEKRFSTVPFVQSNAPNWGCVELDYDRTIIPDINQDVLFCTIFDKNRNRVAGIYKRSLSTGVTKCGLIAYKQGVTTNNCSEVYSCIDKDGNTWGEAPTPQSNSNTNHIATTEWVRDRLDELDSSIQKEVSMIPNNKGWVSRAQNTLYTAETNGYIFFVVTGANHCATGTVYIDNQTQEMAVSQYGSGSCNERNGYTFPIAKGSTYKSTGGTLYWIPVK